MEFDKENIGEPNKKMKTKSIVKKIEKSPITAYDGFLCDSKKVNQDSENRQSNSYNNSSHLDGNDTHKHPSVEVIEIEPDEHTSLECQLASCDEAIVRTVPPRKRVHQFDLKQSSASERPEQKTTELPNDQPARAQEHQMSRTTLKENVAHVTPSRVQRLATDLLNASNSRAEQVSSICSTQSNAGKFEPQLYNRQLEYRTNEFISEITKWDSKWLLDKHENPFKYHIDFKRLNSIMPIMHLDTNFADLSTFQRFVEIFFISQLHRSYWILSYMFRVENLWEGHGQFSATKWNKNVPSFQK